ncbi:MAG: radical SAM protein [Ruminococcus sp.]|nr:radical SAM protein [Ruminococcus sp.]
MAHSNISIFVTHVGCPHLCAFCDQRTITGTADLPGGEDVRRICAEQLGRIKEPGETEIAFFGGSFTAIERSYMTELLEAAAEFVGEGRFRGIRLSTRPDYIDREVLTLLKSYGVTAVELGAQSLDDKVLEANERGHSAQDILDAAELIKEYGFELGLQLMVGLYKSSRETELANLERVLAVRPDTVRIYPVVVLGGTKLAKLYQSGEYKLMPMDEVTDICAVMLERFEEAGIKVLKCGLHASEFVERDMVAGYYHPAFREICEGLIYRRAFEREIEKAGIKKGVAGFLVPSRQLSKALGQKKSNVRFFEKKGITLKITPSDELEEKLRLIKITDAGR